MDRISSIKTKHGPIMTIFGSSSCKPGSVLYEIAEEIGQLVTKHGFTIVNGGYTGTMDATAKGASKNNGYSIGVTTNDIVEVNPSAFLSEEIREETLMTRLDSLINLGDVYLFLPGSTGTLTELALVWDKQKLEIIPIKPCILWGVKWRKVYDLFFKENDPLVPLSPWKKDAEVKKNIYCINGIKELDLLLQKLLARH